MSMSREHSFSRTRSLTVPCGIIAALVVLSAGFGLANRSTESTFEHVTVAGETVEIYGSGLYRNSATFQAGANHGSDALALMLGVPALIASTLLFRRGSTRAGLVLLGVLAYFAFMYGTYTLASAFNNLFIVYIALFGMSSWAFVTLFLSIDPSALTRRSSPQMPRLLPAAFMFCVGLVVTVIWQHRPVSSFLSDEIFLEGTTTMVTNPLDLPIIIPAALLSGFLILRRVPQGYLIAAPLLVLVALLLPLMALQTAFQLDAGVEFPREALLWVFAGFVVLSFGALLVLVSLLRAVSDAPDNQDVPG